MSFMILSVLLFIKFHGHSSLDKDTLGYSGPQPKCGCCRKMHNDRRLGTVGYFT
jgi:hypothetical protein